MPTEADLRVHICPLCASYVEVDGGYDGPEYTWGCSHERLVREPGRINVADYLSPTYREQERSRLCWEEWKVALAAYRYKREDYDKPFDPTLDHPCGLTYTPADRRKRHEFRHSPHTERYSAIMKHLYAEPIRKALHSNSMFLAASLGEQRDARIDICRTINRTVFGGCIGDEDVVS